MTTARDRIDAAAKAAGWAAPVAEHGAWTYKRGTHYVRVQYDVYGRVVSGHLAKRSMPRTDTATHIIGYLYGYQGARFEHARFIIGSPKAGTDRPDVCTVTATRRSHGVTSVYYTNESGMRFVTEAHKLPAIIGSHLGSGQ